MKKKILFIIPSLTSGGAEKSLINLLNVIDFSRYDVNLAMLSRTSVFMEMLPKDVKLVDLPQNHRTFSLPLRQSVMAFFSKGNLILAYHRIAFALKYRLTTNMNLAEQKSWKHMRKAIGKLPGKYDAAVGYLEKTSIYFCVDCVDAAKKSGFIRTHYDKLDLDVPHDESYFKKLDHLCVNGFGSLDVLKARFPKLTGKLRVILNVVSPQLIAKMSDAPTGFPMDKPTILSIGRLDKVKGFDMAISAAAIMLDRGIDFQWLIIGEGNQRADLQSQITTESLQNHFYLLGEKANPYPYLKNCRIYVQTSRYEGRSSTINEAKIAGRPIVSTDFDSVHELLENNVNALIVRQDPEAIAAGITKLLSDTELQYRFTSNLSHESLGTESELSKFYELL